jgi:hypothetical protein
MGGCERNRAALPLQTAAAVNSRRSQPSSDVGASAQSAFELALDQAPEDDFASISACKKG